MVMNPNGAVPVMDGAVPRIISAFAKDAISGGYLVFASGANNVVDSGASSFSSADIQVAAGASGGQFTGIALGGVTASGSQLAVATRGCFILPANGTVIAGMGVACDGNHAVLPAGSVTLVDGFAGQMIGRALTSAASGGFCIVDIHG